MKNRRIKKIVKRLPKYIILTVISLMVMGPFIWMVTTSFKEYTKVLLFPPQWWPDPIAWWNYTDLFTRQPFHMYLYNSFFVSSLVTIGTCLFASLAGYAFAKIHFPLRNTLFLVLLSSMMIPIEVTSIPLFVGLSYFELADSHFPLIVPQIFGSGGAFGVFLLRQFFITVPDELDEAAKIDGCTPWRTFWKIMAPMAMPSFATLCIFTFLNNWNEYFLPLIYLSSSKLYTVPLALSLFASETGVEWNLIMAAATVSTIPLLTVFFMAQKKFIESLAMTGMK